MGRIPFSFLAQRKGIAIVAHHGHSKSFEGLEVVIFTDGMKENLHARIKIHKIMHLMSDARDRLADGERGI